MDEKCLELDLGLGYGPKRDNQLKNNNKRRVLLDLSISHLPNDHVTNSSSGLKIDAEISTNCSKEDDDDTSFSNNCTRKKLRLTKDQTILLEDSFKQHCTLNMAQKQALVEQLNLKPRQVEVWFQNRRARTKLKQTELNCQFQKKNCEMLSEENMRLKKELLELHSFVSTEKIAPLSQLLPSPFSYRFLEAAAALKKCEACERINESSGGRSGMPDTAAATAGEMVREPKPNNLEERVELN